MGVLQDIFSIKEKAETASGQKRVEWIDIAKLFGMIAIYLGHFGEQAGTAYGFVFAFHVPFFFFLSGCMNTYDREENFGKYILKRAQRILLPFYGFALVSIPPKMYTQGKAHLFDHVDEYLLQILLGAIRNRFFALALWFLTCLFVMEVMFKAIKYTKRKVLIFLIPLLCFLFTTYGLKPGPFADPRIPYNIDSALYYMIFFAAGYLAYPYLIRLFQLDSKTKKILFLVIYIVTLAYSAGVLFGVDLLSWPYINNDNVILLMVAVKAILISMAVLMSARLLVRVPQLAHMGRKTLFLCGNEYIMKFLVPGVAGKLGFEIRLFHPLIALLYTVFLIVLCVYIVIPVEEWMLKVTAEIIFRRERKKEE